MTDCVNRMRPVFLTLFRHADSRCDVRSDGETEQTSKGIPPPTCYVGRPKDKPGKHLRISPTCEVKALLFVRVFSRFSSKSPVTLIALSPYVPFIDVANGRRPVLVFSSRSFAVANIILSLYYCCLFAIKNVHRMSVLFFAYG